MTGTVGRWVVRGHYPDGDVIEEYTTQADAEAAERRCLAQGVAVATIVPDHTGGVAPDRCSFCGKPRSAVARMVAGPAAPAGAGVAICNECVALCAEIMGAGPSA